MGPRRSCQSNEDEDLEMVVMVAGSGSREAARSNGCSTASSRNGHSEIIMEEDKQQML